MGDDYERHAARAGEREQQFEDALGVRPVEVAGGFVGEQAGRLGDERPGDRHALALPARELGREVRQPRFQPHLGQQRPRSLQRLGPGPAPDHPRQRHVLERSEFWQQMVELIDEAEHGVAQPAAGGFVEREHRLPRPAHFAATGPVEPAQQVQQGALARTGSPDDGHTLAGHHRQIHAVEDGERRARVEVYLAQRPRLQYRRFGPPGRRLTHGAAPRLAAGAKRASWDRGWRAA